MKGLLCFTALGLTACAINPTAPEPAAHTMRIGGDSYVIRQLTASTWTLTTEGSPLVLPVGTMAKTHLLNAIEQTSGCKVTDSDYALQGRQLDAQVDCDTRLPGPASQIKK